MKQLLRFNQLRSTHRTTVEATVRALLVAWALQDGIVAELRALLPTAPLGASSDAPSDARLVVSTWSLVGLGLETLRQQVQHRWSLARLQTCLPRLRRFLCSRPVVASIRKPSCAPGWRGGIPRGHSLRTRPHEQYGLENAP